MIKVLIISVLTVSGPVFGKSTYICNGVNSLSFSKEEPSDRFNPEKMFFNSDTLEFCKRNGNILIYRKNDCTPGNSVIQYDWILKKIYLNEQPRQIEMQCKK